MDQPLTPHQKWLGVIKQYDDTFKRWHARVERILKRYRDDQRGNSDNSAAKFNILWSNVQTLIPAVYARMPKADVSRRFTDNDPVGRVAALIIERALDYEIEHFPDYRSAMRNSVEDRFLGGRGTTWIRYDPHLKKQDAQLTDDVTGVDPANDLAGTEAVPEELDYECSPADYVHWRDFGHTVARTWEEVGAVWRIVYMDRPALIERFGEKVAKTIPLDSGPEQLTKQSPTTQDNNKAKIYEIWDKDAGKALWLSDSSVGIIDERDDPLSLEGFFPCPKPLFSTTTTDSLIPVPDFTLYQDQAKELDILTDRIDGLIKALKVRGVYNAAIPALQRLLTEGDNNTLIPVENWSNLSEKGGLAGAVDLLDIKMIAEALVMAYQAHEEVKGQVYEITGISDIIRGQTAASETATAQQIKGQYAGLRLKSMQEAVALYATQLLQLKAQIICTKFQPQTLMAYAAVQQMSEDDQQYVPQAIELIRSSPLRSFRVEVAADSLVQIDEEQTKKERTEFITAFGALMKEAIPVVQSQPELLPMTMEAIRFVVAGYKGARQLEGTIDTALQKLSAAAAQAQANPKPDPEMAKVNAQVQADQAKMQAQVQADQVKAQAEQQAAQANAQLEMQKLQAEAAFKEKELATNDAFERWKVQEETMRAITVARISANPNADIQLMETENAAAERLTKELGGHFDKATADIAEAHKGVREMHDNIVQQLQATQAAAMLPKKVVRGPDGRVSGVVTVGHGTMN